MNYFRAKAEISASSGDWEEWLTLFLNGVVEISQQATEAARRILRLREDHRRDIADQLGRAAGNGHRVLEHLDEHSIVSVGEIEELIGTTYPATLEEAERRVTEFVCF